ncbi:MAG: sigma-70 family RNA polymerase sigma factor, partial [Flavobacterium sp.]|nr:sigma-70 family RNA polymerase sigma factor [Flavobacterium sp.]
MSNSLEQSFVTQLKENQNIIHKICRLYTSGEDAHNDLFQEITIQLWKAFPKFRGDSKFSTWAYRVALNTAITLYRKSTRSIATIEFETSRHFIKQEDYNFEEEEQIKLLYKAVHQLNDIEKALVFMYLEDKDYEEISETLGISEVNA